MALSAAHEGGCCTFEVRARTCLHFAITNVPNLLPISAIVPTRNRALPFRRTLESLANQSVQPVEIIVVDASDDDSTANLCSSRIPGLESEIRYFRAHEAGAATQRNEAMRHAREEIILFMDDDILFEPACIRRLYDGLTVSPDVGGVVAMITNQRYLPPGRVSRMIFRFMAGRASESYAGRVLGPAVTLLPDDHDSLPEIVPVEWLCSCCALYRRQAMPDPPFGGNFTGYSMMEDLTLSLIVGRQWKLANVRTARILHDSQPGSHKSDPAVVGEMSVINRHYVMTCVLGRRGMSDYAKLVLWIAFGQVAALLTPSQWGTYPRRVVGELRGLRAIMGRAVDG